MNELQDYANIFASDQVEELARTDMNFFAGLAAPEVCQYPFPTWYVWLWSVLVKSLMSEDRNFDKYAIGLPRGHAKTMVVKLLILLAIIFSKRKYILVIGANEGKAKAIIADVCDMLDSFNIQEVFGNWRYELEIDRQELKKFRFMGRDVILEAAGYGTAIRGSQHKNERPDFIVFDDSQTKECAESLVEAKKYQQWFLGTAMKAKSPHRCLFIYIGNMYKDLKLDASGSVYGCMLRNLVESPEWTSFVVGALLKDGTALWEELQPFGQLMSEFRLDLEMGQPEIFFAEVLNDPKTTTSSYLDTSKIVKTSIHKTSQHQGNYIVIDPATSKQTPDQIVIGYFEIYDEVPVCRQILAGKFTSPETVYAALQMALDNNCGLIVPESNAYQYALVEWFTFVLDQMQLQGIHIEPLYTRGQAKNSRILGLFKSLVKGEMHLTDDTYHIVVPQGLLFDPTKINNLDDILDTCEMGLQVPNKFRHLITVPGDLSTETRLGLMGNPSQLAMPTPIPYT